MIAPSRGAAYRRFYLYSALSVAVIAVAVAAGLLFHLLLTSLGYGVGSFAQDNSRTASLAIALLAIGIPVGAGHLWLILRSFADPGERSAGLRHQYLNLWVAFTLLIVVFAGQAGFSAVSQDGGDATIQGSILAVAATLGAIAAGWISRTPPDSPQPRIRAAVAVMLVSVAVAAVVIAGAAAGAGGIWQNAQRPPTLLIDPALRGPIFNFQAAQQRAQEQAFRAGLLTAGLALTVWSLAFVWQRQWPASRDRLGYALLGYGIGSAAFLIGAAYGMSGAVRFARDTTQMTPLTTTWPAIAAGALLLSVNASLLVRDRGRNGHPAVTTTRFLLAFPALVGLGMVVAGLGLGWHAIVESDLVPAQHSADDLTQAATLIVVGAVAYVPSWRAFDRRTTAESAVRRFYLFTVVCLALVAGLTSGVILLYNTITTVIGVGASPGAADSGRATLTWIVPTLALAAIFLTHLRLLVSDQRLTRSAVSIAPPDPLIALLEDVRAGRVSAEQAAGTIRGGLA